jgi:hypothetical protein
VFYFAGSPKKHCKNTQKAKQLNFDGKYQIKPVTFILVVLELKPHAFSPTITFFFLFPLSLPSLVLAFLIYLLFPSSS